MSVLFVLAATGFVAFVWRQQATNRTKKLNAHINDIYNALKSWEQQLGWRESTIQRTKDGYFIINFAYQKHRVQLHETTINKTRKTILTIWLDKAELSNVYINPPDNYNPFRVPVIAPIVKSGDPSLDRQLIIRGKNRYVTAICTEESRPILASLNTSPIGRVTEQILTMQIDGVLLQHRAVEDTWYKALRVYKVLDFSVSDVPFRLASMIKHDSIPKVRIAAFYHLVKWYPYSEILQDVIENEASNSSPELRLAIAEYLGPIGVCIYECVLNSKSVFRFEAALRLIKIYPERVQLLEVIYIAIKQNVDNRLEMIDLVGRIGNLHSIQHLQEVLSIKPKNQYVIQKTLRAMDRINQRLGKGSLGALSFSTEGGLSISQSE